MDGNWTALICPTTASGRLANIVQQATGHNLGTHQWRYNSSTALNTTLTGVDSIGVIAATGTGGSTQKRRAASNGYPHSTQLHLFGSVDDGGGCSWSPPRVASSSGYGDSELLMSSASSWNLNATATNSDGCVFDGYSRAPLSRSLESLAVMPSSQPQPSQLQQPTIGIDPRLLDYAIFTSPASTSIHATVVNTMHVAPPAHRHVDDSRVNYSFEHDSGVVSFVCIRNSLVIIINL